MGRQKTGLIKDVISGILFNILCQEEVNSWTVWSHLLPLGQMAGCMGICMGVGCFCHLRIKVYVVLNAVLLHGSSKVS